MLFHFFPLKRFLSFLHFQFLISHWPLSLSPSSVYLTLPGSLRTTLNKEGFSKQKKNSQKENKSTLPQGSREFAAGDHISKVKNI